MTRAVPLSKFMPYGAPDLLAAGPTNLARAVFASSALVIAAFFVMLMALPFVPRASAVRMPAVHIIDIGKLPPELMAPPPIEAHRAPPASAAHATAKAGPIVAVRDEAAPSAPPDLGPSSVDGLAGDANATPGDVPAAALTMPQQPRVPDINEYRYRDRSPIAVRIVKPEYPDLAKQAGVDGTVLVHVLVDEDGRVADARVDPKYSVPLLNEFALEAARQWTFHPAMASGHPIMVWETIPFHFVLNP